MTEREWTLEDHENFDRLLPSMVEWYEMRLGWKLDDDGIANVGQHLREWMIRHGEAGAGRRSVDVTDIAPGNRTGIHSDKGNSNRIDSDRNALNPISDQTQAPD